MQGRGLGHDLLLFLSRPLTLSLSPDRGEGNKKQRT